MNLLKKMKKLIFLYCTISKEVEEKQIKRLKELKASRNMKMSKTHLKN